RAPRSTPFPYTTLFRSGGGDRHREAPAGRAAQPVREQGARAVRERRAVGERAAVGGRIGVVGAVTVRGRTRVLHYPQVYVTSCADRKSTRLNSSHDQIS